MLVSRATASPRKRHRGAARHLLLPLFLLDVAGPKSLGPLFDLLFFTQTVGAAIGSVIFGRIFDVTGGYMAGYALSAAIFFCAAISVLGCVETYALAPVAVAGD